MEDEHSREIAELLASNPEASAIYAIAEMHHGRLAWLAEHIRLCDFHIDRSVAKKLLGMLEGRDPESMFEILAVRRGDLPPGTKDPQLTAYRNFEMAIEVARLDGFKRGYGKRARKAVGDSRGLSADYVYRCVMPYKKQALAIVAEKEARDAHLQGEVDFLGLPKPTK